MCAMAYGTARVKCEEVVFECLAKSAEIVLLNRIHEPRQLGRRVGRTRFNIEVDEVDVVRGMMEYWRRDLHLPLQILVVWRENDKSAQSRSRPRLLERWELHFAPSEKPLSGGEDEKELLSQVRALWKRLVLLLRTLYSQSLLLPATKLAREADQARRSGSLSGSLGFAVCMREHDSDAWLLLNGHDSAAYEPQPPLDFEREARVLQISLPAARCAFGTYSISAAYVTPRHSESSSYCAQAHEAVGAKAEATSVDVLRRTPSGLSMLLAAETTSSLPSSQVPQGVLVDEAESDALFVDERGGGGASSIEDVLGPPPVDQREDWPFYDDQDDDEAAGHKLPPHRAHSVEDGASRKPPPLVTQSPPSVHETRPRARRASALAASALAAMPPLLSLGARHISRSAEDSGAERAMKHMVEARRGANAHFDAPFGLHAADDYDELAPSDNGSSASTPVRPRCLSSPLVFAKKAVGRSASSHRPPVAPSRAPAHFSEPRSRAAAAKVAATQRYHHLEDHDYDDEDRDVLRDDATIGSTPAADAVLDKIVSPPFISRFARRLASSHQPQLDSPQQASPDQQQNTFFPDDDDLDLGNNPARSTSDGLPTALGAPPLVMASSPFRRLPFPFASPLSGDDPFDDDPCLLGTPEAYDEDFADIDNLLDCEPPPFAIDDFPCADDELYGADVVKAVAEIIRVARKPPALKLDREPALSVQQLEGDFVKCWQYKKSLADPHRYEGDLERAQLHEGGNSPLQPSQMRHTYNDSIPQRSWHNDTHQAMPPAATIDPADEAMRQLHESLLQSQRDFYGPQH